MAEPLDLMKKRISTEAQMPNIQYTIDQFKNDVISGWVYDPSEPSRHLHINFQIGTDLLTRAIAAEFRPDLLDAGIGSGDHAFSAKFHPELTDEELALISLQIPGVADELICSSQRDLRIAANSRTVYLEVSDLLNFLRHEKRVTGIQRLVSQLCNALTNEETNLRYKYCALLSEGNNKFCELDRTQFGKLIDAILHDSRGDALVPLIDQVVNSVRPLTPKTDDIVLGTGASFSFMNYPLAVRQLKDEFELAYGTIVYDLIPYHSRKTLPPELSVRFSTWLRQMTMLSDFTLSISDYTNRELTDFIKESKIANPNLKTVSIPLGSHIPRPRSTSDISSRYFFEEKFVIFVSTIETRKNHFNLVQAWKRLLAKNLDIPQLVIVGKLGWGAAGLQSAISADDNLSAKVLLIHDASDADLDWLYKHCKFSVYPSFYEGWGLPVTESLARGKVCLCSNTTSLPEAGGAFADYFDPNDISNMADVIYKYCGDSNALKNAERKIAIDFKLRTWNDYARDLDKWLDQHGNKSGRTSCSPELSPGEVIVFTKNRLWDETFFEFVDNRSIAYSAIESGEWFVPEDRGRWLHGNFGSLRIRIPKKHVDSKLTFYLKYWLAVNLEQISYEVRVNGVLIHSYELTGHEIQGDKLLRCTVAPDSNGEILINFVRKRAKRNQLSEPRDLFLCALAIGMSTDLEQRVDVIEKLISY